MQTYLATYSLSDDGVHTHSVRGVFRATDMNTAREYAESKAHTTDDQETGDNKPWNYGDGSSYSVLEFVEEVSQSELEIIKKFGFASEI